MGWFNRSKAPRGEASERKLKIPEGLWIKCLNCNELIYKKELLRNLNVCPKCNYHFRIPAYERINMLLDEGTFKEINSNLKSADPLNFVDSKKYSDRIKGAIAKVGINEAVVTGIGKIDRIDVAIGVFEFAFLGGSMGSVVGEKVARLIEKATEMKFPLIIASSSGGARMHEGILSLMQMAKTSAALAVMREKRVPYISILTDPTTGGVAASFAMLGDVHIAEPKALIGFAGPRVIEQTIRQKLPEGFQRAEYLLDHWMVDMVVERKFLKETISKIISMLI